MHNKSGEMNNGPQNPIAVWKEKDRIDDSIVDVMVMILNGPGCSFFRTNRCSMCGYSNECVDTVIESGNLLSQVDRALLKYNEESYVKIFTSGSFLDQREIPLEVQLKIIQMIHDKQNSIRLLVESRPEFIDNESLSALKKIHSNLEVAIGLETISEKIRSKIIGKRFNLPEFEKAASIVIKNKILLKTYLLMKPPFIGEYMSIRDIVDSIEYLSDSFPGSRVSINPVNVQKDTLVENLYKKGFYRPPWLWTVIESLIKGDDIASGRLEIMSSPTGGGRIRGAHNCGKCDASALTSIQQYSLSGDKERLIEPLDCCKQKWEEHLRISVLSSIIDPIFHEQ